MWKNEVFLNTIRFLILILVQVLVLDHVNLYGFINPFVYVFFILVLPLTGNKTILIFLGFILGLCIDLFNGSGGVHAAASVFIAWVRPAILKYSFGVSYEFNTLKVSKAPFIQQILYISSMVVLHHFILFSLEIFNMKQILFILQQTLFSSILSIVVLVGTLYLFSRN